MFLKMILQQRKSIWFTPGLYAFIAIILAAFVSYLDHKVATSTLWLPLWLFTGAEHGRSILQALTTAILTMTAITFSTIMVVLTTYASQYSPRVLQNFISNRQTLQVLAVFIGTFIYCVIAFLLVKPTLNAEDPFVFSPTIGVILAVVSLGYFVFFIHHVTRSIQVSHLLKHLSQEINESIERQREHKDDDKFKRSKWFLENLDEKLDKARQGIPRIVKSHKKGYIQLISKDELLEKAHNKDIFIEVQRMVGTYVTEESIIYKVWGLSPSEEIDHLQHHITIGEERSTIQDLEFGMEKMADVALRAISPSLNDPNTARSCIFEMGYALMRIAKNGNPTTLFYDKDDALRVMIPKLPFQKLLYFSFNQITLYAQKDISVMTSILEALYLVGELGDANINKELSVFAEYITARIDESSLLSLDRELLKNQMKRLQDVLDEPPSIS